MHQDTAGKVKNDMVDEVMLPSAIVSDGLRFTGNTIKLCQQGT